MFIVVPLLHQLWVNWLPIQCSADLWLSILPWVLCQALLACVAQENSIEPICDIRKLEGIRKEGVQQLF